MAREHPSARSIGWATKRETVKRTRRSSAKQLANLSKTGARSNVIAPQNRPRPAPDQEQADRFALMLHAGIPPPEIMLMIVPDFYRPLVTRYRKYMIRDWMVHPLVREAQAGLSNESWEKSSVIDRLRRGLELHLSQAAYLLYTSNYISAEGEVLEKLKDARRAVSEYLSKGSEDQDAIDKTALGQLLRRILTGADRKSVPYIDGITVPPDTPALPAYEGDEPQ